MKTHPTLIILTLTLLPFLITAAGRQIDTLVYQLYGLTEEEIKIVEEATQ